MIKFVMLLVYLYGGQLKIEKAVFATPEACEASAKARIATQVKDPNFEEGLFAVCVPSKEIEA